MSENNTNLEWEAIRRNWPIILTICMGIGFAIEQWDRVNDAETRIKKLEAIVSVDGIVQFEKWRTKTDMRLERLEE